MGSVVFANHNWAISEARRITRKYIKSYGEKIDLYNISSYGDYQIKVISYSEHMTKAGYCELLFLEDSYIEIDDINKRVIILYNDLVTVARQKFCIAHELGHLVLGHENESGVNELEANSFASEILAPSDVLSYMLEEQVFSVEELMLVFGVSKDSAQKRQQYFLEYKHYNPKYDNNVIKAYSSELLGIGVEVHTDMPSFAL